MPICLLNMNFKIFTKVGTNRIIEVAHKFIKPTESAFMLGQIYLKELSFYMRQFMTFIGKK
jgi:hypothetical protein